MDTAARGGMYTPLMRRAAKIVLSVITALALLIGLFLLWTVLFRPRLRAATDRRFESTPQRLERGRYIVENVASCLRCHSPNHMRKPLAGTAGSGTLFLPDKKILHKIVAPNLTPDP